MEAVKLTDSNNEAPVIPTVVRKTVLQTIGRCCDVCGYTAESFDQYWKHIEQHIPVCHLCNKSFRTLNCLVKHKQSDHNEHTSYRCGVCSKRFSNMSDATSHFSSCRTVTVIRRNYKEANRPNKVCSVTNNTIVTSQEKLPNNCLLMKAVSTSSSNGSTLAFGRNNLTVNSNSSLGYNIIKNRDVSNSTNNSNTSTGITSVTIITLDKNVTNSTTDSSTTAASSDKKATKVASEVIDINKNDGASVKTNSEVRYTYPGTNIEIPYCKVCKRFFATKHVLHRHNLYKHISSPVECKICKKIYGNDFKLNTHMLLHNKRLLTKCNICDKWVTGILNHNKKYHEQRVKRSRKENKGSIAGYDSHVSDATCNICAKTFVTKGVLKRHKRYKHEINEVACEICNKICKNENMLKMHKQVHNDKRICEICGKIVLDIVYHLKTHDSERSIEAICEICGKGFVSLGGLCVHKDMSHSEERPYVCAVCNASFKSRQCLRNHCNRHLEPSFECNVCGRKFKEKNHLKAHLRTHTGEEPFGCKVCGETFKWHSSLKHHKTKCCRIIKH